MDQDALVGPEITDGQKLIEQLLQHNVPVLAGFWLKLNEDTLWYFYVVSPVVDEEGSREAYKRVYAVINQIPEPFWIDRFRVHVVAPTDRVAKEVLAVLRRYPRQTPFRYEAIRLGDISIDGAYLYPVPGTAHKGPQR